MPSAGGGRELENPVPGRAWGELWARVRRVRECPRDPTSPPAAELLGLQYGFLPRHPASYAATGRYGMVDELKNLVEQLHRAGIEVVPRLVFTIRPGCALTLSGWASWKRTTGSDVVGLRLQLQPHREWHGQLQPTGSYAGSRWTACGGRSSSTFDDFCFDLAAIRDRAPHAPLANPPLVARARPGLRDSRSPRLGTPAGSTRSATSPATSGGRVNGRYRGRAAATCKGDTGTIGAGRRARPLRAFTARGRPVGLIRTTASPGTWCPTTTRQRGQRRGKPDGDNAKISWQLRVEGPTDRADVLRRQQQRNAPRAEQRLAGDEVGRFQHGNNNAYCQERGVSGFDRLLVERAPQCLWFARAAIAFRRGAAPCCAGHFPPDRAGARWATSRTSAGWASGIVLDGRGALLLAVTFYDWLGPR